jgi:hypothetical protein
MMPNLAYSLGAQCCLFSNYKVTFGIENSLLDFTSKKLMGSPKPKPDLCQKEREREKGRGEGGRKKGRKGGRK